MMKKISLAIALSLMMAGIAQAEQNAMEGKMQQDMMQMQQDRTAMDNARMKVMQDMDKLKADREQMRMERRDYHQEHKMAQENRGMNNGVQPQGGMQQRPAAPTSTTPTQGGVTQ